MSLKIENVDVYGFEAAIRGMRSPMNSWDKSDSYDNTGYLFEEDFNEDKENGLLPKEAVYTDSFTPGAKCFVVGENDLKLMTNLSKAGDDHGKFLRYLVVQLDITAPFYWWKEFKTYRKGRKFMDNGDEMLDPEEFEMFIETNSCSTMHKIHAKEFELDDFSHDQLSILMEEVLVDVITILNDLRERYIDTKEKRYWWQMIQLLPSSYNQRRTVQLNYQVLKSMYHARKNHKLDEWREFCKWCETLPYFKEICIQA
jgi:hypothetical protein